MSITKLYIYLTCSFVCLVFINCSPSKNLGEKYATDGFDNLFFNSSEKKFVFVEKRELSFSKFSEGNYYFKNNVLYLNSYTQDSAISYKIFSADSIGKMVLYCNNFDKRTNLLYIINGKLYIGDSTGSLIINSIQNINSDIVIKVPFPEVYNSSCLNIYDTLYAKINMKGQRDFNQGIKIEFSLNYNYFNWVPWSDSLIVDKKQVLISKTNGKKYKVKDFDENSISINYLSRCLMPYFPIRRQVIKL